MSKTLFVYGTLMDRYLAADLLGHSVQTYSDSLSGYKKVGLNIVEAENSVVDGVTFEVTPVDLKALDHYEGVAHQLYKRIAVRLDSGGDAIAYQKCDPDSRVSTPHGIG